MPQMPGMSAMRSRDRRDRTIARGRADDLDQRARLDSRPDSAVVRVEPAHRDRRAGRQTQRFSPSASESCPAGRPGAKALSYNRSRSSASLGSSRARKDLEGRPPQASRVHRLVARGTDAADDLAWIVDAGENGRDVVGELDPAGRGVEHVRRDVQAVPDLRPPPLRRIGAADRREVSWRVRRAIR